MPNRNATTIATVSPSRNGRAQASSGHRANAWHSSAVGTMAGDG